MRTQACQTESVEEREEGGAPDVVLRFQPCQCHPFGESIYYKDFAAPNNETRLVANETQR